MLLIKKQSNWKDFRNIRLQLEHGEKTKNCYNAIFCWFQPLRITRFYLQWAKIERSRFYSKERIQKSLNEVFELSGLGMGLNLSVGSTDAEGKELDMSLPEHAIWNELETYFRTRIIGNERVQIVDIIRLALVERPETDLDHLTLKATAAVLKKRPPVRDHR